MNELATIPYNDLDKMAKAMGSGKMFGKTADELLPLMLLAQAEGRHPAFVAQEFDIIQGRPAMNSKSALARFQAAGGRIQWLERTDKAATATFSHPQGGDLTVTWDMARAAAAQLTGKDNWKKFPAQMLSARVVAEGVRAVFPGCLSGFYTVEEADWEREPAKPSPRPAAGPEAPKGKLFDKAAAEPKQATPDAAPRKVEGDAAPIKKTPDSRRVQVITFIGENTDKLTPEQLAELKTALAHAGTTPPLLDAVEMKAKEFLEINAGLEQEPQEDESAPDPAEGGEAQSAATESGEPLGLF